MMVEESRHVKEEMGIAPALKFMLIFTILKTSVITYEKKITKINYNTLLKFCDKNCSGLTRGSTLSDLLLEGSENLMGCWGPNPGRLL